jgi:hypothetical protein
MQRSLEDYEKTLLCYTEILGLRILHEKHGFSMLDTNPIQLNIHQGKVDITTDSTEISFTVNDIDAAYQYLQKNNVRMMREPMKYPDGPRALV